MSCQEDFGNILFKSLVKFRSAKVRNISLLSKNWKVQLQTTYHTTNHGFSWRKSRSSC